MARAEFHMAGEFNATSASGSMCVDCSGAGQAVFGQGGDLGYSLSLSATGARVRLPGAGSDGMRSAAAASDASAQYPHFAIVRWRVEFAGVIRVFANGELLGSTDLGSLPALSLSELGNLHNLTLGTADTSSASDFFSGTALEPATPSAGGCSPMCLWSQPHAPRLCPYMCRAGGRAHRVRRAAYRCARRRGPRVPECQVEADPRPNTCRVVSGHNPGCNPIPQVGARLRAMGVAHVRCWWHRQRRGQERRARWRQHLASLCPGSVERPDAPQPARPQPHAHRQHTERDWPAVSAGSLGAGRLQPARRLAGAAGLAHVAPHPRPCTHRRGRHAADAACAANAADAAAPQRDARERLLALAARQPQHAHPHRARCAARQTRMQPHVPMLQPIQAATPLKKTQPLVLCVQARVACRVCCPPSSQTCSQSCAARATWASTSSRSATFSTFPATSG